MSEQSVEERVELKLNFKKFREYAKDKDRHYDWKTGRFLVEGEVWKPEVVGACLLCRRER